MKSLRNGTNARGRGEKRYSHSSALLRKGKQYLASNPFAQISIVSFIRNNLRNDKSFNVGLIINRCNSQVASLEILVLDIFVLTIKVRGGYLMINH